MGASGADGSVDAYVGDLDALAAALRQDPVNVQQTRGNGQTAVVDAELTEIVASSEVPIYVALVGELPGLALDDPNEDLAIRLQTQLDEDAVYIVSVGSRSTDFYYGGDDPDLESSIYSGLEGTYPAFDDEDAPRPSDAGRAAIIATIVADEEHSLTDAQITRYNESATWTRPSYDDLDDEPFLVSEVSAASVFLGLLVAAVGWRLTRTWVLRAVAPAPVPGASRASGRRVAGRVVTDPTTGPDPEEVRRDAAETLERLTRDLTRRASGPGVDEALGCRVAAESVLDSDDLLDVVGALVLARMGRQLLEDPDRPYRPCFLNPLHGRGYVETRVPVGGGSSVPVPVCRRCSEVSGTARSYRPLLDAPRGWLRTTRPYYAGDTVWARTGFGSIDPELWRRVPGELR